MSRKTVMYPPVCHFRSSSKARRRRLSETPNTKLQAPEKLQTSSNTRQRGSQVFWSLMFGVSLGLGVWSLELSAAPNITVTTNRIGVTPSLVGYNAGHFVPGSNTKDWWRYSGTTGARVFITPSNIEPGDDIAPWGDGVTNATSFLARKAALRANPLNTNYINWPYFTNNYAITDQHGSNLINPNDACASLRAIGVNILVCLTLSEGSFPIADTNDWAGE